MRAAPVLVFALVLSACASVAPVPIRAGDVCFHCRRTITDTKLAAEVISQEGHVFKFSSVVCLTEYLRDHPDERVKATFVTDYARGKMLAADQAWFVKFEADPRLRTVEFAAFRSEDAARAFAGEHGGGSAIDWAAAQAANVQHIGH